MAAGNRKKSGGRVKISRLEAQIAERRRDINEAYAKCHPERAAEERALRQLHSRAGRDFGHKRNGTVETHAKAGVVRQGALARLHMSGAISTEQLGWALEIAAEHERIDAEVGVRTASFETRVDVTRSGEATFFESLWRVRRSVAYTRWRAALSSLCPNRPTGAQHLLAMVVDDLGVTWAAKHLRMSVRKTRALLVDLLEMWPTLMGQVRGDIDEQDVNRIYARLSA